VYDVASLEMRRRLVAHLRRRGYLRDQRVTRAFLTVPRELFLPQELRRVGLAGVYRDDAIVTRRDPQTRAPTSSSSQPAIMAVMLEMLGVRPGERVVEIGAGTGYNAALLGLLTGRDGRVVTLDVDVETATAAARGLRSFRSSAQVVVADGAGSWPLGPAPGVDRLEVTASTDDVPRSWFDQLVPGGTAVVPLRLSDAGDRAHAVTAFVKVEDGFDSVAITSGGFMPLRRPAPVTADGPVVVSAPVPAPVPDESPGPEQPMRRGPWMTLPRDDLSRLHLSVRYTEPPDTRWLIDRGDHWIGIDLLRNL
jgi:protein-L-isoaspartate(D-aspartate) O-methyltransferase